MAIFLEVRLFLICNFLFFVDGHLLQDAKQLHLDLLTGYMKNVFPINNQSEAMEIDINFVLFSVNAFREVEERISVTGGISMSWTDVSLPWDPALYGGITIIYLPPSLVWTPHVYLLNTPEKLKTVGEDPEYLISVNSNGSVSYSPGDVMEATCPTDVSKFPYDVQTCILEFLPWNVAVNHLAISSSTEYVLLPYFTANSDWSLNHHSTSIEFINDRYYTYKVKISLKREPTYYAVIIIFPTILFCLLNPVVFLLPVESGERVSMAMTMLLSYAIFLTLVSNSIPATSNPMCFLLVIMIIIIAKSGLILLFVIISLKYYYDETTKNGKFIKLFILLTNGRKTASLNTVRLSVKDIVRYLDILFIVSSYVLIFATIMSYIIFVHI